MLIEVAEGSLDFDRGEKAQLYAAARILDYWIVNLVDRTVEVHRDPRDGRYFSIQSFGPGATVAPIAVPESQLDVTALFAGPSRLPPNRLPPDQTAV